MIAAESGDAEIHESGDAEIHEAPRHVICIAVFVECIARSFENIFVARGSRWLSTSS